MHDETTLQCYVEVYDRVFCCRRRPQRSMLSLVKKRETKEVHLLWQTRQNELGTRYKIVNNISRTYSGNIDKGKFTISFNEPPHNLLIKSDNIKKFIHLMAHVSKGNDISRYDICLQKPSFTFNTAYEGREVVVTKKSKYPILQGFPQTTEKLYLRGLDRKSFDRQILRLQSLRILNLENNQISYLPKELGTLPYLEKLFLSGNCLGKSSILTNKWAWMEQTAVSKNLTELDLSNNKIAVLPMQIGKLCALVHLRVSQNLLQNVPQTIVKLRNLRSLDLSRNHLLYLPGIIRLMNLAHLNISSNAFISRGLTGIVDMEIPSLVDLAAKIVVESRRPYDASVIPHTLITYLDNINYCCICRKPCFYLYIKEFLIMDLTSTAYGLSEIYRDRKDLLIQSECYFCSFRCASAAVSYGFRFNLF